MIAFVIFAAAMALAQAPASGSSTTSSPPPAGAAASKPAVSRAKANDDDKVTCQTIATTGSLIADRVCHSNAVWRAMSDQSQDEMRSNLTPAGTPK